MTSHMSRSYLDYNATAPLRANARAAMIAALDSVGNPSSVHREGRAAREEIERAREAVAALVGGKPQNVIFTGGGTEANNTALLMGSKAGAGENSHIILSAIEHPSILRGHNLPLARTHVMPVTRDGVLDLAALRAKLIELQQERAQILVSIAHANNETGAIQPIAQIAELVHEYGGVLHSDCVQSVGKIAVDCEALGADMITLSAHKIGGPQGIGALVLRDETRPFKNILIDGGGQERKRRAGTENVAAIAGFGAAAQAALQELRTDKPKTIAALRDKLEQSLVQSTAEQGQGVHIFSKSAPRLPNTSCFAVSGMSAEMLVIAFDLEGVALSSGSACSSGKVEPSHVLEALGAPLDEVNAALRVSLGWESTMQHVEHFTQVWDKLYGQFCQRQSAA